MIRSLARARLGNVTFGRNQYISQIRRYSSGRQDPPKLIYIVAIAVLSSAAFVMSVQSLDKKAPKTEMSVQEYEAVKRNNLLKYKRTSFSPGQIELFLAPQGLEKVPADYVYIDVDQLINSKDIEVNKYHHIVERFQQENLPLPTVTTLAIVQDAIKHSLEEHPDRKKFVIGGNGFPSTITEAIKFEQDVATVSALISNDESSEVTQYFATVDKVKKSLS